MHVMNTISIRSQKYCTYIDMSLAISETAESFTFADQCAGRILKSGTPAVTRAIFV